MDEWMNENNRSKYRMKNWKTRRQLIKKIIDIVGMIDYEKIENDCDVDRMGERRKYVRVIEPKIDCKKKKKPKRRNIILTLSPVKFKLKRSDLYVQS